MLSTSTNSTAMLFLSTIGAMFLIAFWSYYTSYPGLLSSSGIEPVSRLMPYAAPWLYREIIQQQSAMIDSDSLCELLSVVGICLSCVVISGYTQHGILFVTLTVIYSFLTRVGGVFYSFQWDILLLETGIVVGLCYAPWLSLRCRQEKHTSSSNAGSWPARFLLFKLMFMSGVVKIMAECPTWMNLTALEYHFATQCLPSPLAWYAHQLHPLLLRISVAATLWIEIPLAVLLLVPNTTCRRFSCWFQILLQISIILTGNYNWFNLQTIALCLPCMEQHDDDLFRWKKNFGQKRLLEQIGLVAFSAWSIRAMFDLSFVDDDEHWSVSLRLSKKDCDGLSEWIVPIATVGTMALIIWSCVANMMMASSQQRARKTMATTTTTTMTMFHGLVCVLAVGIMAVPMCSLTPNLERDGFLGSKLIFAPLWLSYARPYRLANPYGLFRRMTGVGHASSSSKGWAGQPPSVVERPEIILEGVFDGGTEEEGERWYELSFRWKPGDPRLVPQQVAPHQPRLDWQMWFAALGSARQSFWFLNLIKKLLDHCEPVNHLLGDLKLRSKRRRLKKVRAKLYHYDFTRIDTKWSRGIPGVEIANMTGWKPDRYWTRTFVRPYFQPTGANDTNLETHLSSYAYHSYCVTEEERCIYTPTIWCRLSSKIRSGNLHLLPIAFILAGIVVRLRRAALNKINNRM
jgi:hypothetical protein